MSDEFFGRILENEMRFDRCDNCGSESPKWLHSKHEDTNVFAVTFLCDNCHDQANKYQPQISRQITDKEEIAENTRPAWMEEFIQEQKSTGALVELGDDEISNPDEVDFSNRENSDIPPDEVPEYFPDEVPSETHQVANWSTSFIQEALFGANPQAWLEDQGGFTAESLGTTVQTLGELAQQSGPVQISALTCLGAAITADSGSHADRIKEILSRFKDNGDEIVQQIINRFI